MIIAATPAIHSLSSKSIKYNKLASFSMAIMFLLVHGSLLFLPPLEKIFPFFLILLKQNKNPVVIFPREREGEEILQQDWVVLVFWEKNSLSPFSIFLFLLV